jgi:hypothetical protein
MKSVGQQKHHGNHVPCLLQRDVSKNGDPWPLMEALLFSAISGQLIFSVTTRWCERSLSEA